MIVPLAEPPSSVIATGRQPESQDPADRDDRSSTSNDTFPPTLAAAAAGFSFSRARYPTHWRRVLRGLACARRSAPGRDRGRARPRDARGRAGGGRPPSGRGRGRRAPARPPSRSPSRRGSGCGSGRPAAGWPGSARRPRARSAPAPRSRCGSGIGTADEQREGVRVDRVRVDLLGRADLDDLAEVHDRDPVGDVADHAEVVGDEDVGEARTRPGGPRAG